MYRLGHCLHRRGSGTTCIAAASTHCCAGKLSSIYVCKSADLRSIRFHQLSQYGRFKWSVHSPSCAPLCRSRTEHFFTVTISFRSYALCRSRSSPCRSIAISNKHIAAQLECQPAKRPCFTAAHPTSHDSDSEDDA